MKPCPFCNGYTEIDYHTKFTEFWTDIFYVMCMQCGARGPQRQTRELAISSWNQWGRFLNNQGSKKENNHEPSDEQAGLSDKG